MARIAIAGFQHETNSFSPVDADWQSFLRTTSWPGLIVGADVKPAIAGMNLALAGFLAAAETGGHEATPILWANATPSGPVTDEAFERITAILISRLADLAAVDAIFLDLHGAMITQTYRDGEAEILRRVRAIVGDAIPIIAALDLHANTSPAMTSLVDALVPCRTYPHTDLAETGIRAHAILAKLLGRRKMVQRAYWQPDFLIPIQAQTTHIQPSRRLYEQAAQIEADFGLLSLSLTLGFGPSDTPHCGPAIAGFGYEQEAVDVAVAQLAGLLRAAEAEFRQPTLLADAAVARAMGIGRPGRPAVLADLQDNPGAGGTGDTTGLLAALSEAEARGAVLGVLYDPAAAAEAHAAGVGSRLTMSLGGKRGGAGSVPLVCEVTIEQVANGRFRGTGPMYGGAEMDLGSMALLTLSSGPKVIVGSVNTHTADQSILRHLGIEPIEQRIVALKSAVHFRADFEPIASEVIVVQAPGACAADHHAYPYQHLRGGVRLMPSRSCQFQQSRE